MLIGLGNVRLTSVEARVGAAVGHCLVLQRAFAALVAHRAVQRMVDQQQFHHAVLGLVGGLGGELGAHHHVGGDDDGAGRHRFALSLDLDQALPAGADRVQQRVVAEPRDLDAHQLGRANHQSSLGNTDFVAVDGQRHHLAADVTSSPVCGLGRTSHKRRQAFRAFGAVSMESRGSNGQPPPSTWAMYSSRKYLIDDITGLAAPSPNAQNDFPKMASEMSSSLSRSSLVPLPVSRRS